MSNYYSFWFFNISARSLSAFSFFHFALRIAASRWLTFSSTRILPGTERTQNRKSGLLQGWGPNAFCHLPKPRCAEQSLWAIKTRLIKLEHPLAQSIQFSQLSQDFNQPRFCRIHARLNRKKKFFLLFFIFIVRADIRLFPAKDKLASFRRKFTACCSLWDASSR